VASSVTDFETAVTAVASSRTGVATAVSAGASSLAAVATAVRGVLISWTGVAAEVSGIAAEMGGPATIPGARSVRAVRSLEDLEVTIGQLGEDGGRGAEPGRSRFAVVVTLAFLAVAGLGVLRHEMWRDEMQAWMFAADSASPAEMLHAMRYEGHPPLWHLLLFAVSRGTRHPEAMQLLNLLFAATAVWLFARWAPFPRRVRALFAFGYFPLYEYGVISRNYAIGLLLLFAFCALRTARPRSRQSSRLPLAALLAALALTNAYAWLLSLILFAVLARDARRDPAARSWKTALGALLFLAAAGAAALQMIPAADGYYGVHLKPRWNVDVTVASLATVAHADLPLPELGNPEAWNTSLLWRLGYVPMALLGLALIAAVAVLLRRAPAALFVYLAGTAAILAFTCFEYFGSLRHHGHHFLLLVACLWLAGPDRRRDLLLTALLLVHLAAAAVLYPLDLALPFSESRAAADLLRSNGLAAAPIAATQDHLVSPVAGYLGRPLYYLDSRSPGSYVLWNRARREHLPPAELCLRLREWLAKNGGATVLLSTQPLSCGPDLEMLPLADLRQSMVPDERYSVLVVRAAR